VRRFAVVANVANMVLLAGDKKLYGARFPMVRDTG
jgi:hypothetical protein